MKGLFVSFVLSGSQADQLGIRSGDTIFMANDMRVKNIDDFRLAEQRCMGTIHNVLFERKGKKIYLEWERVKSARLSSFRKN